MRISIRYGWLVLRTTSALALAIAPYQIAFHGSAPGLVVASAHAKDGGGSGGGGGGGSGSGGGSNSGSGNSGSSGHGGGDDGAGDDHGGAGNSGHGNAHNDDANDDNGHHVNSATGDKVEVEGNKIEVTHPDGTREEIENGRFEMKDALGRTIVERPATPADTARLQAL